jgi:hypothetical protein
MGGHCGYLKTDPRHLGQARKGTYGPHHQPADLTIRTWRGCRGEGSTAPRDSACTSKAPLRLSVGARRTMRRPQPEYKAPAETLRRH